MRVHTLMSVRTAAALLTAALGLSACVSNVRDDGPYYGDSVPLTPAEQRLRAQSKSYTYTATQACLSVGAVAAVAPDMKCKLLAQGASEALVQCGCRDLDETFTLLYSIMAGITRS